MKKLKFKKEYRDLEMRVLANLRYKIQSSSNYSEHIREKCIKVNVFDYTELVNLNDTLTFLDKDGLHYSIFTDATLEDLIDIINTQPN